MRRINVLFIALLLSLVIAVTTWSKEKTHYESVLRGIERNSAIVHVPGENKSVEVKDEIPLHAAVKEKDIAKVKSLIDEGDDVNCRDEKGATALFYAVARGNGDIVRLLLANGAGTETGGVVISPLTLAVIKRDIELIKLLIANGADVNGKSDETPPLHMATLPGYIDVMELLINSGADVNATDGDGNTPIYKAFFKKNT